ncbi:hypothetical protein ACP70R_033845 [Stipagrostis hirtigluma subsp. patula]
MAGGRKREWMRKKMAMVAGSDRRQRPSPRWALRIRALSAALRRRRLRHVDVVQLVYENVVFYLMWVLESIVVLAKLCFFFLRFGFRL